MGFFQLVFGEIKEEEKAILEEKIIQCYQKKGITLEDRTLYQTIKKKQKQEVVFKTGKQMPILEDLYYILQQDARTQIFSVKLFPFVKGSLNFFNHPTNISLDNLLVVADISDLGEKYLPYGMFLFSDIFWDRIKNNKKNKKSIYLDEIWKMIGVVSCSEVASFILTIFKTIRKYNGSAVSITQDISDLFSFQEGAYGRSILNNSSIKTFFSLEEGDIKILSKQVEISTKEQIEIRKLKKGECLMLVGNNHILTKIECSNKEKELIEGEDVYEKNNNSIRRK